MPFEAITGLRLSIYIAGRGDPTLIFVHGGACDHHDWDAQFKSLSTEFRTVVFDVPGHGESEIPARGTVADIASAVCEIKARYGNNRAVLVGHGLGCRLVLEASRQSPSGVIGIVLAEGSRFAKGGPERAVNAVKEKLRIIGMEGFLDAAVREMFTANSDPALRARVMARAKQWDHRFAEELLLSCIRWDAIELSPALAQVSVPLLLLQSTHINEDFRLQSLRPGMASAWIDFVKGIVPRAEHRIVPDVGHLLMIEASAIFNEHIKAFSRRLTARSRQATRTTLSE